uniref:Uncharacterized protein n=1 Tax=Arundo donax TaxID=35708 RepID=A0A0A9GZF8_ARUDO
MLTHQMRALLHKLNKTMQVK